jgi:hypothetical protein
MTKKWEVASWVWNTLTWVVMLGWFGGWITYGCQNKTPDGELAPLANWMIIGPVALVFGAAVIAVFVGLALMAGDHIRNHPPIRRVTKPVTTDLRTLEGESVSRPWYLPRMAADCQWCGQINEGPCMNAERHRRMDLHFS